MPKRSQRVPAAYIRYREELAEQIGARIRQRRLELGLTQTALQARLNLDGVHISRSQYSRIEVGKRLPDAAELLVLAASLATSVDWLLAGAGSEAE